MLNILVWKDNEIIIRKNAATLIATYGEPNKGIWSSHCLQALDPSNDAPLNMNMSTFVGMLDTLLDILKQWPEMRPLAREKLSLFADAAQDICCSTDSPAARKQEDS